MAKQARIELQQTKNTTAETQELKSPIAGRVTRVYRQVGDPISRGEVLADVEVRSPTDALEVVAFVPASFGQRVAAGHAVQITVAGVRREEAGFLKGTVAYVSEALVSADRVTSVTKETAKEGASYELRIAPTPDPATISGYAWSTGKGPLQTFSGAVPVDIAVEVGERRPISQFVPFFRSLFGI
jgi:pyruvate/2-oxoglutarate dehydrogenase complex dihydrolipoamide acyltransferase (E2) component